MAGIAAGNSMVFSRAPSPVYVPRPATGGLGRLRKIAIVGTAWTVHFAPWDDPTWEIWAHASAAAMCQRVDRYFDLHPQKFWTKPKKWDKTYLQWLTRNAVPIWMQKRYAEVPASIKYPKERVVSEFRPYFTSQAAWMIALALTEGVTHIGFFGVHYSSDSEYAHQRPGCEYWMGQAEGRGVQIVLPPGNPMLRTPSRLYGYESHDSGELHADYRVKKPALPDAKESASLNPLTVIDMENPDAPRPALRELSEPIAWERSGHPAPKLIGGEFKYF